MSQQVPPGYAPRPPGPAAYYAAAPLPPQGAPPRRSNAGSIVALIVVVGFVLTGLTVGGFLAYERFFGGLRKTLLAAQDLVPDDVKEQTLDYQGKVKVTVPRGLLARKTHLELSAISGAPKADDMASVHDVYDVVLGDLHQFDDYVQLELPIDPATLSPRSSGKTRHVLMAFNAAAGTWSPIVYRRTPGRTSLTVFTDHLSAFGGVDGIVPELSPTMKLPYGASTGSMEPSANLSRAVQLLGKGEPLGETAFDLGFESFNENFALATAGLTFGEEALEMTGLHEINEDLTKFGYGLAVAQLFMDLMSEKTTDDRAKTVLNGIKNVGMIAIGEGWSALKIAGCAVTVLDVSLSRFANAAFRGRREEWNRAYHDCYQNEGELRRSEGQWYQILKGIVAKNTTPETLRAALDKEIGDYTREAWKDELRLAFCFPGTMTGGGGLNDALETDISNGYRNELMEGPVGRALGTIQRRMIITLIANNDAAQNKLAAKYNMLRTLNVSVNTPDPKQSVAGYDVEIGVTKDQKLWRGTTDKAGHFTMQFTALGYLEYGGTGKAKLTIPGAAGTEPKTLEAPVRISGQVVNVVFTLGAVTGQFVGRVSGTTQPPGYDKPATFDGPVTVRIDDKGAVSLEFSASSKTSAGKGAAAMAFSVTGKLAGKIDGQSLKAQGPGNARWDLNLKLPPGYPKVPVPTTGSSAATIVADGTIDDKGQNIKGKLKSADGKGLTLDFVAHGAN